MNKIMDTPHRASVPGYATVVRRVFTKEEMAGLGQELADRDQTYKAFPRGSANALPVKEALERLADADLPHFGGVVEDLAALAASRYVKLDHVAWYDVCTLRTTRPNRNQIGVPAIRTSVQISGHSDYRTGGHAILGSHIGGLPQTVMTGDIFFSNDTDTANLPLSSVLSADGQRLTLDFLTGPTPVISPDFADSPWIPLAS